MEREETAYLNYRVQQWQSSLAPELQVDPDGDLVIESLTPARNRLRVLFCLRTNHLRMMIHRGALLTPDIMIQDSTSAKVAVDLAKDTIILLNRLHRTSDLYGSHRACFNYFLYSALTLLFLAVHRAKAQFHENCRKEFLMALDLIGGYSAKSNVAKKLWKVIKYLRVLGPNNGILPYMETQTGEENHTRHQEIPHSEVNQPVDMQGQLLESTLVATQPKFSTQEMEGLETSMPDVGPNFFTDNYAVDGSWLSSELSSLYQAIDPRFEQIPSQLMNQQESHASKFGTAQDFSRSLWNIF